MMGGLKQLQLNIAHLIDNTADQEALVNLFLNIKTGGAKAMLDEKNARAIIDLRSIYGENLDHAINFLMENKNKLTTGENVLTTEECGK
jgi:hypothetical protein